MKSQASEQGGSVRKGEPRRRKRIAEPPNPELVAQRVRNHWQSIVISTCERNAMLLELVPRGQSDLGYLPAQVRHRCAELRDEAVREELALGSRPLRLEQWVNTELWRLLQAFTPGAFAAQQELL